MKNQSLKNRTVGLLLFFGLLSLIVRGQFIKKIDSLALVDKPGKLTHLRRIKLTIANELPRFDLSLG